jgi:acetoin utilization deacetylase AcuC-like enzyme
MKVCLYGDKTPIDWQALNVKMPFAPMHELAAKYKDELTEHDVKLPVLNFTNTDIDRTFELKPVGLLTSKKAALVARIKYRTANTVAALDTCSVDSISINLGGGYHHSGKHPNTGYAYSLINDIIWAVDYQLEQSPDGKIGIVDLDFHFGGGTFEYYLDKSWVYVTDVYHPKGVLHQHDLCQRRDKRWSISNIGQRKQIQSLWNPSRANADYDLDKLLINIGTDWLSTDLLFGQYNQDEASDLLNWWQTYIHSCVSRQIPIAITMGGGYGEAGLELYQELIEWIKGLPS